MSQLTQGRHGKVGRNVDLRVPGSRRPPCLDPEAIASDRCRLQAGRSSTLNFGQPLSQTMLARNYSADPPVEVPRTTGKALAMKKAVLALATAATIGITALAAPSPAEARWRGGGWGWGGGWGPGLAGGLLAGALIGGIASSAYAYGPGYGYYGGPAYGYYGGYAPAYYGYAPAYYGGYTSSYYAPAYYGPRYRRVVRPAYAYYGPRYHRGYRYRW